MMGVRVSSHILLPTRLSALGTSGRGSRIREVCEERIACVAERACFGRKESLGKKNFQQRKIRGGKVEKTGHSPGFLIMRREGLREEI